MDEEEARGGGAPEWMVTYSDMVTLLLCFFVLLYSMSTVDQQKLIGLMSSMAQTFNPRSLQTDSPPTGPVDNPDVVGASQLLAGTTVASPMVAKGRKDDHGRGPGGQSRMDKKLGSVAKEVQRISHQMKLDKQLTAEVNARGTVISFAEVADRAGNVAPFRSGSAELEPKFREVLRRIVPLLQSAGTKIEVQGHTDRRPINTVPFPSNWELSCARAGSVVRFFTLGNGLPPGQFVATGFADTVPVDSADTPDGWARNRRIEVVITRHPVSVYDEMSRADAAVNQVDITNPIGHELVRTGLPAAPKAAAAPAD